MPICDIVGVGSCPLCYEMKPTSHRHRSNVAKALFPVRVENFVPAVND